MIARLLTAAFLLLQLTASAQKPISEVNYTNFMKEITLNMYEENELQMSLWMPTVFWNVTAASDPNMTPEVLREITHIVDDYIILCVVKAHMNNEEMQFETTPESVLRKKVTLNAGGKSFKPLYYNELSTEAQQIKDIVEPLFSRMLGDLGGGMTILYFKAKDEDGKYYVDPYSAEDFYIDLDGTKMNYNLPLASLQYDKQCPVDHADFPANYTYCPFHGKELEEGVHTTPPPVQDEYENVQPSGRTNNRRR